MYREIPPIHFSTNVLPGQFSVTGHEKGLQENVLSSRSTSWVKTALHFPHANVFWELIIVAWLTPTTMPFKTIFIYK